MQLAPDVFPRKDQRRVTEAKTSLKKGHRVLSIFIAENFVVACLLPPLNMKLGNLCRSRQLGQKKMCKKAWCCVECLLCLLNLSDQTAAGRGGVGEGGTRWLETVWRENCKELTCSFSWFSRSWWLGNYKTIIRPDLHLLHKLIRGYVLGPWFLCMSFNCLFGVPLTAIVIIWWTNKSKIKRIRNLSEPFQPMRLKSSFKFTRSCNYPL